jgi:O-antigen/teichoic acid export membrane protein
LEQTLKEKTAKGLFWGGISNGVQQLVGAVFGIAIARILSPSDYGLVGMLAIFTAIANTILDSGFTAALTNKKEIKHEDYNAVFWFGVIVGIVMYVVLFLCAPLISTFYGKPELTPLARVVFLNFLVSGCAVAHYAIMFKKLMVKERAKIDITSVIVSGTVGIVLAINGFAYWGLAIQTLTFTVTGVILRWYFSPWRPTLVLNFQPLKEMFGFSSKLFMTSVLGQITNNVFSVILGKFYGEKQVGYYAQGSKWMLMGYSMIGGMIGSVAQPVFVESIGDKNRMRMIFRKMLRFNAFVSFPAMLGLAFISNEFILITVGEKWSESVPLLQLLCVWAAASGVGYLYVLVLIAFGKSNICLYVHAGVFGLQLLCAALMFPFGILPMVAAYALCGLLATAVWHHFANRFIGIRWWQVLQDVSPYLGITVGCFAVAWLVAEEAQNLYLKCALKIAVAAGLYVMVMKYSKSTMFRESLRFLVARVEKH